jgi:hypothetical protein
MLATFLQATFRRFGGKFDELSPQAGRAPACTGTLEQAVEHVVDGTSARLRAVPGYARRLREPVITALRAIDEMVEQIPGVLTCRRGTYTADPGVGAFFVSYTHLREVFSESKEVRALFDSSVGADECYALLCMRREERRQLGVAMDGDLVRKDVMQTTISFTDHQLVSPGQDESDARCALKCCIFNSVIGHLRQKASEALTRADELEGRAQAWQGRLKRQAPGSSEHAAIQREIEEIERQRQGQDLRLDTLEDHFRYVADALSHPETIVNSRRLSVFVDRLGMKYDGPEGHQVRELEFSEIQMTGQPARVASLVCFPREELLPKRDFLREASIFLAA